MKILVIGATGTIGSAVVTALGGQHEVIPASRNSDVFVDLSDPNSIALMYKALPKLDAVVSTGGNAKFGPLDDLTDEDFAFGLGNKLMGQVNLVRFGRDHVNDGGSFTLTSGILSTQPHAGAVMLTMLNSAVEGFVRASALGMPRGQRLNAVSPSLIKETAIKMGWGNGGMPAAEIANYYVQSVESNWNGEIIDSVPVATAMNF